MRKKMIFLWIDDESNRIREKEPIEDELNVTINFEDVNKKDIFEELGRILQETEPDLVLIDHKLDKTLDASLVGTGATVAEIIREKWPECPIIAITNVELKDIPLHKQLIYEQIVEHTKISRSYSAFYSIAFSFRQLKKHRPSNIDQLMKMLRPPKEDVQRLEGIVPEAIRNHFNDNSLNANIFRWVNHTLMVRAGFLYDRLWLSTTLGLKEGSLTKVEDEFTKAQYKGIFANIDNERWWQSKVKEIIFSKFSESKEVLPWVLGRKLPRITSRDFSECYVCGRHFPETVAYTDETSRTRKPMHVDCTIKHPNFESLLYFEDIRMMKPEI